MRLNFFEAFHQKKKTPMYLRAASTYLTITSAWNHYDYCLLSALTGFRCMTCLMQRQARMASSSVAKEHSCSRIDFPTSVSISDQLCYEQLPAGLLPNLSDADLFERL